MHLVGPERSKNSRFVGMRCVRGEDSVGQADDRVEVELLDELGLDPRRNSIAEQRAVGNDHGGAAAPPHPLPLSQRERGDWRPLSR